MITYRNNSRTGEWNVFGPQREMRVGVITVHKKEGSTKSERVLRLSKPFDVNGEPYVFGYLETEQTHRTCDSCGSQIRGKGSWVYDINRIRGFVCPACASEAEHESLF